jgi:hypothetical protein
MLDFQAVRLLHRHGNGEYASMVERSEASVETNDPERQWIKGTRIFKCSTCPEEIVIQPVAAHNGEGPNPSA